MVKNTVNACEIAECIGCNVTFFIFVFEKGRSIAQLAFHNLNEGMEMRSFLDKSLPLDCRIASDF